MKLELNDLEDLARGAAFLGTGGGGDPYIGRLLTKHAIETHGNPQIIEVNDLDDDATIFVIAMLGAPTVIYEKGASGEDMDLAIQRMEERIGKKADAIIPAEAGGINSLMPIAAAARNKLPLVNGDGMGRAFPELQMVSFSIYGISPTPTSVVDEHLNSAIVETSDPKVAEEIVRSIAIQMGLNVIICAFPMTGKEAKKVALHGTLEISLEVGRAIAQGRITGDPIGSVLNYLSTTPYYEHNRILFDGKVIDLQRETTRGFSIGQCTIASLDSMDDQLHIEFQNEYLVARHNGVVKTIVPDLICIVERETAEPIPVEYLRYGQRVKVIGISAAPILRTPEALKVVGPKAFGLDEPFTPIEDID